VLLRAAAAAAAVWGEGAWVLMELGPGMEGLGGRTLRLRQRREISLLAVGAGLWAAAAALSAW
jgi:hypothetical protein